MPQARPQLDVLVTSGKNELARWHFINGDKVVEKTLNLPAAAMHDDCVDLKFQMSSVVSPAAIGLSNDARELNLGLIDLTVDNYN